MKKIGIIDIGSNSIRLVIVQINKDNSFSITDEIKESVRLGKDMTSNGSLNSFRIDKAIYTLSFFKRLCIIQNVSEILAVATEAVRKATNQKEFLNRVKLELSIDIRVLTGIEESYYDYFGAINSMDFSDALIMDIGGSSSELILVKNRKLKNSISLPFGAINLTEKFSLLKVMNDKSETAIKTFLISLYKDIPWLKEVKNVPIIGIGGTIRNIGKLHQKKTNYPIDNLHNYIIPTNEVISIYDAVKIKDSYQRKKLKGLSKERADIFVGATAALVTLIEYLNIKELHVSGSGLRDGLIFEYIFKSNIPLIDVLDFSLKNQLLNYKIDLNHPNHVWMLTQALYNGLNSIANITINPYKILKTAAMLHDIGILISYFDHHKHSSYMIANSKINGLTHKEQLMASYIAALHRKNEFKIDLKLYQNLITKQDLEIVDKLSILLRICESLDRCLNGNIKMVSCIIELDTVTISVDAKADPILEISAAVDCSSSFKKIYNKKLVIR
ncbi:Ppx/GppA phosphatase family protein [Clostridium psychrophilum]|uniref:Ppx/GppA phosphatase family protein n=1 Tax=Clostridium psychrophilum TaxID=132926 RepID=UPI001C0AAEA7|nr:Ppx/GppA phosphatase family protein [Clostridium psychrophilum]MBU3180063.1 Ppx/GppA family phosphatase [Clostridium psychrophilum]